MHLISTEQPAKWQHLLIKAFGIISTKVA